jgi:hypothetical protein
MEIFWKMEERETLRKLGVMAGEMELEVIRGEDQEIKMETILVGEESRGQMERLSQDNLN